MLQSVGFDYIEMKTKLSPGDLLTIKPSKKYQNQFYKLVWKLYPRWLVRILGERYRLTLLISANKPR